MKKSILLSSSVLVAASFAAPAMAQNDEIVVTATKREQTLQDVPVSVSVTEADTIEKAQINDILDLQSVVPSLRVSQLQNSVQTDFRIRGFGNGANNAGIEPSVAVFIDGVYRSRSGAAISDLPNIERVEVLRGPQSTLFGKNASAGVISVVTSKPQYEWDGYAEVGISNYNGREVKGYLTGPLSENVAFSLGGSVNKRDGYGTIVNLDKDISDRDRWALRGQLLFEPTDNMSFRLTGDYDEIDEVCCLVSNLVDGPTGNAVRAVGGNAAFEDPFSYNTFLNFAPTNKFENSGIALESKFEFDNFTLTSITSKRKSERQNDGDVDFTSADIIGSNAQTLDIDTFTQEFQLASDFDGPVNFLVGAYYFDEDIDQTDSILYGNDARGYIQALTGGPSSPLSAIEGILGFGPGTFFRQGTGVKEFATQSNQAYSFFGQADWEITDRLTATVGLSYIKDEKEVTLRQDHSDVFATVDLRGAQGRQVLITQGIAGQFPNISLACGLGAQPFSPAAVASVLGVASCPGLGGASGAAAFGGLQTTVTNTVNGLNLSDPAQNPLLALAPLQFLPPLLAFPNAAQDGKSSDNNTDYSVRLAYDWTDSINVYGSVSTGFKATSWNLSRDSRPFQAERDALAAAGVTLPPNLTTGTRFAPGEETLVYELGLKGQFEKGSVNVAVFDQEIKNFQSNVFTGTGFSLASAGTQSVKGFEVDTIFYPTENLTLTASGTFLDPLYDDFKNSAIGDVSGQTPGGIHKTSLAMSATWEWEGNGYDGFVRGDWQYDSDVDIQDGGQSNVGNSAPAANGFGSREVNTINASAGIAMGQYELTVWGRNLFNDEYLITNFPSVAQNGSFSGYPSTPRMVGVSLRANLN